MIQWNWVAYLLGAFFLWGWEGHTSFTAPILRFSTGLLYETLY